MLYLTNLILAINSQFIVKNIKSNNPLNQRFNNSSFNHYFLKSLLLFCISMTYISIQAQEHQQKYIPEDAMDEHYTVLAIVLDGKIKLYRERSGAIESN